MVVAGIWRSPIAFAAVIWPLALVAAQADEPGILDNFQSGLPIAIWSEGQADEAIIAINSTQNSRLTAVNRLRNAILLAESSPELAEPISHRLGAARIDYLYRDGALDQAEALAQLYQTSDPNIQPLAENLALLTTRSAVYCQALLAGELSPITQGTDIYCLLRDDQYDKAVAIFDANRANYDPEKQALLARYLDLDDDKDPARDEPWQALPAPLSFVMDEALGRPRGRQALPLPYLYYARNVGGAPRSLLEATEALVQAAALPPNILIYAYRQNRSAESGGAWGRAEIIQALDAMNPEAPNATLERYLPLAFDLFTEARLLQVFAKEAKQWLAGIPLGAIDNQRTRQLIIRLGLLGGWSQPSWRAEIVASDYDAQLAMSIRHPFGAPPPPAANADRRVRLIYDAYFNSTPVSIIPPTGLRLWRALVVLDDLANQDADVVATAFHTLDGLGQSAIAADIATSVLLGS